MPECFFDLMKLGLCNKKNCLIKCLSPTEEKKSLIVVYFPLQLCSLQHAWILAAETSQTDIWSVCAIHVWLLHIRKYCYSIHYEHKETTKTFSNTQTVNLRSTHLELTGGKHISSSVLVQTTVAVLTVSLPYARSQESQHLNAHHLQKAITGDQHFTQKGHSLKLNSRS